MNQQRVESRLSELRRDFGEGERALQELDARREQLQVSLLRVGGAIQVLEELLATSEEVQTQPGDAGADAEAGTVTANRTDPGSGEVEGVGTADSAAVGVVAGGVDGVAGGVAGRMAAPAGRSSSGGAGSAAVRRPTTGAGAVSGSAP